MIGKDHLRDKDAILGNPVPPQELFEELVEPIQNNYSTICTYHSVM